MSPIICRMALLALVGAAVVLPGHDAARADTRAYRHCHNEARFTRCFTKDPREPAPPRKP